MLGVLPPILVADTKIIYGYNFVAPLRPKDTVLVKRKMIIMR